MDCTRLGIFSVPEEERKVRSISAVTFSRPGWLIFSETMRSIVDCVVMGAMMVSMMAARV